MRILTSRNNDRLLPEVFLVIAVGVAGSTECAGRAAFIMRVEELILDAIERNNDLALVWDANIEMTLNSNRCSVNNDIGRRRKMKTSKNMKTTGDSQG